MENICDGVGGKYFYTCIWQCVTNNGPVRLPAISYVLTHYSRKVPMEDQLFLMGHDIDLMVHNCILQKKNVLYKLFVGLWIMCRSTRFKCSCPKISFRSIDVMFSNA